MPRICHSRPRRSDWAQGSAIPVERRETADETRHAAEFRVIAYDLAGREVDFPWHSLINDCASPVIWTRLNGTVESGFISYLKIQTNACQGGIFPSCSSSAYSRHFNDSLG
jgi:hypothetical protein